MKKISFYKTGCYLEPDSHCRNKIKEELNLSKYLELGKRFILKA